MIFILVYRGSHICICNRQLKLQHHYNKNNIYTRGTAFWFPGFKYYFLISTPYNSATSGDLRNREDGRTGSMYFLRYLLLKRFLTCSQEALIH